MKNDYMRIYRFPYIRSIDTNLVKFDHGPLVKSYLFPAVTTGHHKAIQMRDNAPTSNDK